MRTYVHKHCAAPSYSYSILRKMTGLQKSLCSKKKSIKGKCKALLFSQSMFAFRHLIKRRKQNQTPQPLILPWERPRKGNILAKNSFRIDAHDTPRDSFNPS